MDGQALLAAHDCFYTGMSGHGRKLPHDSGATTDIESATVAILLCTCQGERFLGSQLRSIRDQTHRRWHLVVSDDGSTDGTRDLLEPNSDIAMQGRLDVRNGPRKGFVANFLSLACDTAIQGDYFAFCDQDDVWEADKLERALRWLAGRPAHLPALYCSRTRLIDESGRELGLSPLFSRAVTFRNALVQSIAGGNTMVFNRAARDLLAEAGPDVDVITHDWWLYMLVTGCGGQAHYDFHPGVCYRQHGDNLVGSNAGWMARYQRARRLMAGRFRDMNRRNIIALRRIEHRMDPDSRIVLRRFERARDAWLVPRIFGVLRSGVYHHTLFGTLGLAAATVCGKL